MKREKLHFFDSFNLYSMRNVRFRMHRPVKDPDNPILRPENDWEGWRAFPYGRAVLRDPADGLFKMWYETMHDGEPSGMLWERTGVKRMAYATSKDGVTWHRPNLGQVRRNGSTANSIVETGPFGTHFGNVIIDDHETDPNRRYKMMFWAVAPKQIQTNLISSINVAASPDGVNWNLLRDLSDPPFGARPTMDGQKAKAYRFGHQGPYGVRTAGDAVSLLGWVENQGRYVAYLKSSDHVPASFRTICYTESADFINWSRLVSVLHPDERDAPGTEFYYMTVFPFGDLYVGLLSVYHNYSRRPGAWADATAEVPAELSPMDQHMDVRLAFSRDGQVWQQAGNREAFIPLGEGSDWDGGVIYGSTLLDVGDEVYVYYAGTPMRHVKDDLQHAGTERDGQTWSIFGGLARLRKDGFVSLRADGTAGEVVTRPVEFSGLAPRFNAKTDRDGEVEIQILDADANPLTVCESTVFQGDEANGKMDLPGSVLENLKGQSLRLRIVLRNADLYTVTC